MLLFVGLGNPGDEYKETRHNMGFMCLDHLMEDHLGEEINKKGFQGLYLKTNVHGKPVVFLKPQTYMNLSGQSVREVVNFFKIKPEEIVVIYDDMDLEPGRIRIRKNGSSGGQKGIGNIIENLGTQEIKRIRVGIGKADRSVVDYVLGKPSSDDQLKIDAALEKACKAIEDIIDNGFEHTMSQFN